MENQRRPVLEVEDNHIVTRFGAYPLLVARPALLRDADSSLDGTGETQCRRCCRSPAAATARRPGGLARDKKGNG